MLDNMNLGCFKSLLFVCMLLFLFSCEKEAEVEQISQERNSLHGQIQKGAFRIGSSIQLNELNEDLTQTGNAYSTLTESDLGFFDFGKIDIKSNIAELTATGFYYNELTGKISPTYIILEMFADISDSSEVNVNVFNHVIHDRIEKLVSNGMQFSSAKELASEELMNLLGFNGLENYELNTFDINKSNSSGAALLAFSIIVQNSYPRLNFEIWHNSHQDYYDANNVAKTSEFLSNFRVDFADNGKIDNQEYIDYLVTNANRLDRNFVGLKYKEFQESNELGSNVADFSRYLDLFLLKNGNLIEAISFPDSSYKDQPWYNTQKSKNLLASNSEDYRFENDYMVYSIAADVPIGEKVKVEFNLNQIKNKDFEVFNESYISNWGWRKSQIDSTIILETTRSNQTCFLSARMLGHDTLTFKIFRNNETTPSIKTIYW